MIAAKLKSITLDAAQVQYVQEHGKLVRFVVMKRQGCMPSDWDQWGTEAQSAVIRQFAPFSPGERVWCKEEWHVACLTVPGVISKTGEGVVYRSGYSGAPCDADGPFFEWRPAADMTEHHSRLTLELASVEPVEHDGKWCWKEAWTKVEADDA